MIYCTVYIYRTVAKFVTFKTIFGLFTVRNTLSILRDIQRSIMYYKRIQYFYNIMCTCSA